ncbi:universal stress protein uspa-like protein [Haloferax mucosum ATCC BAA-1512]|uniref:Universal stress protein uspa-like protein n=1 Tax=Haloferax mucosum ATCC BAA-1512 TaxID=662479 RepID=M0IQ72_9EURY|nr:universal stress protein [Haloferax mucosum]ELZ98187.1 universal stress protein uspa-like protein [Haloferax mucosum ATCC BAA-1512]
MYENILVPTDESDHALAAAEHACELASAHGATVHVVYVVDTQTNWLTISKNEVRETAREIGEEMGTRALTDIERLGQEYDVPLVTELREGTPEEEILEYVADNDIDLVVMGTHGRQGIKRRLVGSVTEHVVGESPVPVLTTSTTATQDASDA